MAELTDDVVDQALRDVRVSLLEADVELGVVKRFLARVREKVLGQVVQVQASVTWWLAVSLLVTCIRTVSLSPGRTAPRKHRFWLT
jgi:signal recognition particle GTPase